MSELTDDQIDDLRGMNTIFNSKLADGRHVQLRLNTETGSIQLLLAHLPGGSRYTQFGTPGDTGYEGGGLSLVFAPHETEIEKTGSATICDVCDEVVVK